MNIYGFNKLTLLDFPGKVAATIFLGGCNFRCPFCHNGGLALRPGEQPEIPLDEVLSHLKKRRKILDGVCVSGGEPTLYQDLPKLFAAIKELGLSAKLDTNGTDPDMIKALYNQHLLDYVAMDIKSSPEGYEKAAGVSLPSLAPILESADFLMNSGVDYEFRTTVVRELHQEQDFYEISRWLAGCRRYFLQAYQDGEQNISRQFTSYSYRELQQFQKILQEKIPLVELRGIEP